jgi:hypothetical protein
MSRCRHVYGIAFCISSVLYSAAFSSHLSQHISLPPQIFLVPGAHHDRQLSGLGGIRLFLAVTHHNCYLGAICLGTTFVSSALISGNSFYIILCSLYINIGEGWNGEQNEWSVVVVGLLWYPTTTCVLL